MTASQKSELHNPFQEQRPITAAQFMELARILYNVCGIRLLDNKNSLLTSRLGKRMRALGFESWDQYIALLEKPGSPEVIHFINSLTTNKTAFFREEKHFEFLKHTWLPARGQSSQQILAWIAASSYGHEAYTLGMVLGETMINGKASLPWKILATDIDTEALDTAQRGVYTSDQVTKEIPASLIQKYFLKGTGPNAGKLKVSEELSANIKFRHHNLVAFDQSIPLRFDIIFLRNVLIYFDKETVEKVISKCVRHLKPGGLLFLGHCESILEMKWDLTNLGPSIYRRPYE